MYNDLDAEVFGARFKDNSKVKGFNLSSSATAMLPQTVLCLKRIRHCTGKNMQTCITAELLTLSTLKSTCIY